MSGGVTFLMLKTEYNFLFSRFDTLRLSKAEDWGMHYEGSVKEDQLYNLLYHNFQENKRLG
ncbi:hypothetical protein EDC24_1056 [Aquisalibacillus elongatus]|uniref:Uncharacterized protein n=2 Tax=Aquisalibacillus elongatus TaxID=485577 RepID=A0A3N5B912_9BACI|nr:hypothetical protein EDC24_1056 [Aquisalibacillus elongatus]